MAIIFLLIKIGKTQCSRSAVLLIFEKIGLGKPTWGRSTLPFVKLIKKDNRKIYQRDKMSEEIKNDCVFYRVHIKEA